jgi:hypothetical protein
VIRDKKEITLIKEKMRCVSNLYEWRLEKRKHTGGKT